jgi:hypothetical protein
LATDILMGLMKDVCPTKNDNRVNLYRSVKNVEI